jgi:tRNA-modifying protein YgfZ
MSSLVVDFSSWACIHIHGADRVRFLNGLSTINVPVLAENGGTHWGAILNPKARMMPMFALSATVGADHFVLRCEPTLKDKTLGLLQRYAVMDDVEFSDVAGPCHRHWSSEQDPWQAPFIAGLGQGALPIDDARVEAARISAGFVRYGVDVDEDCFPFETPLAQFLDYQKGCYVGQEPVFRVHSQGNASRALRVVVIAGTEAISAGTTISHADRPNAGQITSSIAVDGNTLALAFLHRSVLSHQEFIVAGRAATLRAET